MLYSAQTGGFYTEAVNEHIPEDAKLVINYDELLAGQGAGQRITPDLAGFPVLADPLPSISVCVSALQAMKAISTLSMVEAYEAWTNSPERTFIERAFINKAQTWERSNPTLIAAAADLGMTVEQIDAFFALAATL